MIKIINLQQPYFLFLTISEPSGINLSPPSVIVSFKSPTKLSKSSAPQGRAYFKEAEL